MSFFPKELDHLYSILKKGRKKKLQYLASYEFKDEFTESDKFLIKNK